MSDHVLALLEETLTLRLGYRQIPSAGALPWHQRSPRAPVDPDRALAVHVSPLCPRGEPGFLDVAIFRVPAVQSQHRPQHTTFCTSLCTLEVNYLIPKQLVALTGIEPVFEP